MMHLGTRASAPAPFQCTRPQVQLAQPRSLDLACNAFKVPQGLLAAASAAVLLGSPMAAQAEITPVYFGNGCFWGRQKDFIDTEKEMGRKTEQLSSVVGYAGGQSNSGKTCYYYNTPDTLYENQGHAEVTQVGIDSESAEAEFGRFAETYFGQFRKTPFGMIRQDPQDRGPGYRNVVGIPGGVNSPLFAVLQAKNVNGMKLVPSEGNVMDRGKPAEDDAINTVYVSDSSVLPFHEAEVYHQFHNGIGKPFGNEYTNKMKNAKIKDGTLRGSPGCAEFPMF